MHRRTFPKAGLVRLALSQVSTLSLGQQLPVDPKPGPWRTFGLVTRVELARASGESRVWIPLPTDGIVRDTAREIA